MVGEGQGSGVEVVEDGSGLGLGVVQKGLEWGGCVGDGRGPRVVVRLNV